MNNLIVSYELLAPEHNLERVISMLKAAGSCIRLRYSLWHVKTSRSAAQVAETLSGLMGPQDNVIVIDATTGNAAWCNLDSKTSSELRQRWNSK